MPEYLPGPEPERASAGGSEQFRSSQESGSHVESDPGLACSLGKIVTFSLVQLPPAVGWQLFISYSFGTRWSTAERLLSETSLVALSRHETELGPRLLQQPE